jgi:hypothetical protein
VGSLGLDGSRRSGCSGGNHERYQWFIADSAVRTNFVVVEMRVLRFPASVVNRQEPIVVQALGSELAVRRLVIDIVHGLAVFGAVLDQMALVGLQIEIAIGARLPKGLCLPPRLRNVSRS